jgi:hypothetical protein
MGSFSEANAIYYAKVHSSLASKSSPFTIISLLSLPIARPLMLTFGSPELFMLSICAARRRARTLRELAMTSGAEGRILRVGKETA